MPGKNTNIFISALLAFLIAPETAYAYIDPGSGSYMLQILLAALLGAVFFIKSTWHRIKDFLSNLFSTKTDEEK